MCVFASSVDFLGQYVSAEWINPLGAWVAAIQRHPKPDTKSQMMSFLGMLNFYRWYIREADVILKPLTDVTRGSGGKLSKLDWMGTMEKAFLANKAALTVATYLAHPVQEAELALAVDAPSNPSTAGS